MIHFPIVLGGTTKDSEQRVAAVYCTCKHNQKMVWLERGHAYQPHPLLAIRFLLMHMTIDN